MSQFSAAGVTSKGAPVNVLFGWDCGRGLWASVYDPSLHPNIPFVEYRHQTPVKLKAVLNKYKVNANDAIPESVYSWPQDEQEQWAGMA